MPGAEVRVDHAQKGLNNHRLSLQEIVVTQMKGSDLWGGNRNVRYLQSDTNSLAPGRKKRTPSHFPEDRFGTRSCAAALCRTLGLPGPFTLCVHHIFQSRPLSQVPELATDRQGWTPGRCLRGKMAWHPPKKDQWPGKQSIHARVTHHASTIGHIPVKNPTTMQSWEMGNPSIQGLLWSLEFPIRMI